MPTANIVIVLTLTSSCLVLVLITLLLRRKLYRRFPLFFAYCIWIIVAAFRTLLARYPVTYFLVHWSIEGSYVLLAFLTMLSVLRPFTQLAYIRHPWSRFLLLPFIILVVFLSSWCAFVTPIDTTAIARFASAIYVFVLLMSFAELTLFLISLRVKGRYPIQWTPYEFGILAGFGVMAFLNLLDCFVLVLRLLHLHVDSYLENFFRVFSAGAFIGSAAIWISVFSRPDKLPTGRPDFGKLEDALRVMEEQLEAVKELGRRLGLLRTGIAG